MNDRDISYLKSIVKYCEDIASIHESYDNSYKNTIRTEGISIQYASV